MPRTPAARDRAWNAVRLPGEGGLARKARHLRDGVALHPAIMPALRPLAVERHVPLPVESP